MTLALRSHEAGIATLIVVESNLIEIHYRPGIVFTSGAVLEVQEMRRSLMGSRPHATLTIIPEDVDYRMDAMQYDQGKPDRTQSKLFASAVVAKASMIEMLTKLYFSYFPQPHRVHVTDSEVDARTWLDAQMKEVAQAQS